MQLVFLRATAECFARLNHRLGICPSVRPSVTLVICVKTVYARIMKSSQWDAPKTLVLDFLLQNFVPLGEGVPLERGRQRRVPLLKRRYYAANGSYSVKTVADRYRLAAHGNKQW